MSDDGTAMKSKWNMHSFGDIAEFRNGVNFTQTSQGRSLKVVGVGDFRDREVLNDFSATTKVVIDGDISRDDLLVNNDLLFVRSNGNKALVGRCVLLENIAETITFSGFTIRARIKSKDVDPIFISKLVRSSLFWQHLHWYGSGSSINNLSQDTLASFEFNLPPLREQRDIAAILQAWDEAIDQASSLLSAKRTYFSAIRRNCMQAFSSLARGPEPLGRISTRIRRRNNGQEHPAMTISAKSGFLLQSDKYSREMAGSSLEHYTLLRKGEFAYNKGNSLTSPQGCIFRLDQESALVPHVYFCFSLTDKAFSDFYVHVFESGYLNHQLFRVINSGVRNDGLLNLASEDFFRCTVPFPPHDEQVRIARTLDALKSEIRLFERQLGLLQKQKRGLMQKLLTGTWRVNVDGGAL